MSGMELFLSIFEGSTPYLAWPKSISGWIGLLLFFGLVAVLTWKWRWIQVRERYQWLLFGIFFFAQIAASLFVGVTLQLDRGLPPPGIPAVGSTPIVMVFSAIPWVLATGFLGSVPAAILGAISGAVLGLYHTHSPFTILEFGLMGVYMAGAVNQRYRTWPYALIRRPMLVLIVFAFVYPLAYVLNTILITPGDFLLVFDFALSNLSSNSIAVGIGLVIAGVFAETAALVFPEWWGRNTPLEPSPSEKNLETRSLYLFGPAIVLFVIVLTVLGWNIAGGAAQKLIQDRMKSSVQLAAESVHYAFEVGQSSLLQMAESGELTANSKNVMDDFLARRLQETGYFQELFVVGADQTLVGGVIGPFDGAQVPLEPEERIGVELAFQGVPFQYYTLHQVNVDDPARLTFLAGIPGSNGVVERVLIGRSDLDSNPFIIPILNSLQSLDEMGEGMLLSERGIIIFHTDKSRTMEVYPQPLDALFGYFEETAPDGTRSFGYYQYAIGRSWAILVTVDARQVQRLASQIAAPLLTLLLVLSVLVLWFLKIVLGLVTRSLRELAVDANRIAQDQSELSIPLPVEGEDEVGQLRRAFEKMRVSLKERLDEQEQFLLVSQGVAASLEIQTAIQPILDAALATGASAARITLSELVYSELEEKAPAQFGKGVSAHEYGWLDQQVLGLVSSQSRVVLTNPTRARTLTFMPGSKVPEALLAVALRHENAFYGALWVGYDRPHHFSEGEVRYLTTISSQAALAAANATLFSRAEIGRKRLEAILAATPDAVLVTDYQNKLLLANPVALNLFGVDLTSYQGLPLNEVIDNPGVIALMSGSGKPNQENSREVLIGDNQVYYGTVSTVLIEARTLGQVCVLRDITHYKALDALKSEFVNTVSHDLRSPLTLIHGYATMLQMVGEINEQQSSYIKKITTGVENMSRLVSDLLDLGRIEAGVGLRLEKMSLSKVVLDLIERMRIQVIQKKIELDVQVQNDTQGLYNIEADKALVEQCVQNLMDNAIKYTPEKGKVTVELVVDGYPETILLKISDTGIGIAPVDQPRLFDRFFRVADRETRKQRGSGLGLSIVKSIVERHHGRIWVKSQLGKGSTFYLEFPVRQPESSV